MTAKQIGFDFSKCVYTVSGSNLVFDSKEMVWKYLQKKWGLAEDQITTFATAAGHLESDADVQTLKLNYREVKIVRRRMVSERNLDLAIAQGW